MTRISEERLSEISRVAEQSDEPVPDDSDGVELMATDEEIVELVRGYRVHGELFRELIRGYRESADKGMCRRAGCATYTVLVNQAGDPLCQSHGGEARSNWGPAVERSRRTSPFIDSGYARERVIRTIERDHAASFDLTIPDVRRSLALWLEARSTDAHWSALAWRAMVNFTPAETREIVLAHYRREEWSFENCAKL